jgi:hypothetical protein
VGGPAADREDRHNPCSFKVKLEAAGHEGACCAARPSTRRSSSPSSDSLPTRNRQSPADVSGRPTPTGEPQMMSHPLVRLALCCLWTLPFLAGAAPRGDLTPQPGAQAAGGGAKVQCAPRRAVQGRRRPALAGARGGLRAARLAPRRSCARECRRSGLCPPRW